MMAKPMKTLELHYPMIKFLIMSVMSENGNVFLLPLHGNTDFVLFLFYQDAERGRQLFCLWNSPFDGVNFPANGPVMQRKTVKWEPSTEKMYVRDGVLKGDVNMALLLLGGGHYRCDFRTTYK